MNYDKNVFINCPFDKDYLKLLKPLLFSIIYAGYTPRLALESSDSGELRLEKILGLIRNSQLSIHDLSRLQAAKHNDFYRLNMPFELGLDYSARCFRKELSNKKFLILETQKYDYMKAISDINGLDIKSHDDEPERIVECVINWFSETLRLWRLGSSKEIWYIFQDFNTYLFNEKYHKYLKEYDDRKSEDFARHEIERLPIPEYIFEIEEYLKNKKSR
jgi:hypothetical protein